MKDKASPSHHDTVGVQVSKCCEGLQCERSSGVCCCNRIHSNFNMAASVEDILDEILMSDNDSETEQLVESAGLQRVADMEEKLEAQIKNVWKLSTCLIWGIMFTFSRRAFVNKSKAPSKPLNHQQTHGRSC